MVESFGLVVCNNVREDWRQYRNNKTAESKLRFFDTLNESEEQLKEYIANKKEQLRLLHATNEDERQLIIDPTRSATAYFDIIGESWSIFESYNDSRDAFLASGCSLAEMALTGHIIAMFKELPRYLLVRKLEDYKITQNQMTDAKRAIRQLRWLRLLAYFT